MMEELLGLRIYRDGRVERWFRNCYWKEVKNTANHGDGYNLVKVDGKMWLRHRLVVAAFNKQFDINNIEHQVDHIDGDRLNNAFDNLRVVSSQGNHFNRPTAKGCDWHRPTGKWRAQLMVNGKSKHLGLFDTEEAARAAYLAAKEKYHVIQTIC
tara:strand:+ start:199 stop:660 length:462 start_codon:yes stop_codon:yes gene_type:complete